jgi:hypothetical protein
MIGPFERLLRLVDRVVRNTVVPMFAVSDALPPQKKLWVVMLVPTGARITSLSRLNGPSPSSAEPMNGTAGSGYGPFLPPARSRS